jgi:ribosome-associated heat shock protein Hsp15
MTESTQRLDKFLWCARILRGREDCAAFVAEGHVRINRQITEKPHAKLRVGDVLSFALRGEVKVWRIVKLPERRGPAAEARALYDEIIDPASCTDSASAAYPTHDSSLPISPPPGDQQ